MGNRRLLLICGMPTTGKTTIGNWLRDERGFVHLDLECHDCLRANGLPAFWRERIGDLDRPGLAAFVAYVRGRARDTVLTWAFHPDLIPFVRELVRAGFEPWWFEGDRLAARVRHATRGVILRHGEYRGGSPDMAAWDRYVASLAARWSEIGPIFGENIVRTLGHGGAYATGERIFADLERPTGSSAR